MSLPTSPTTPRIGHISLRAIDVAKLDEFTPWFMAHDSAWRHDFPDGPFQRKHESWVSHRPSLTYNVIPIVAEGASGVVGTSVVRLPLKDNRNTAFGELTVLPRYRRLGIGIALLTAIEQVARDHGRIRLISDVWSPSQPEKSAGMRFAERRGYRQGVVEIMKAQRPPFHADRLTDMEAQAWPHATGYRMVTWRGRVPEKNVDEVIRLASRMSVDIPLGELDYEPEIWDAARLRADEDAAERMRRTAWYTAALAPDDTMAGWTEVLVADKGRIGYQKDTLVDPDHRGHRLGLLLKIANLRAVLRAHPTIGAIWTWNADINTFMASINDMLGYVDVGRISRYQRAI